MAKLKINPIWLIVIVLGAMFLISQVMKGEDIGLSQIILPQSVADADTNPCLDYEDEINCTTKINNDTRLECDWVDDSCELTEYGYCTLSGGNYTDGDCDCPENILTVSENQECIYETCVDFYKPRCGVDNETYQNSCDMGDVEVQCYTECPCITPQMRCEDTDGTWDEEDEDCDCGKCMLFDEDDKGCYADESPQCSGEGEELCEDTGGDWDADDLSCECGDDTSWEDFDEGCTDFEFELCEDTEGTWKDGKKTCECKRNYVWNKEDGCMHEDLELCEDTKGDWDEEDEDCDCDTGFVWDNDDGCVKDKAKEDLCKDTDGVWSSSKEKCTCDTGGTWSSTKGCVYEEEEPGTSFVNGYFIIGVIIAIAAALIFLPAMLGKKRRR